MRYYLEVFPDESLEPGQTYTLTIQVQDMFYQTLYLPMIRK
jgi:hypothetical protein